MGEPKPPRGKKAEMEKDQEVSIETTVETQEQQIIEEYLRIVPADIIQLGELKLQQETAQSPEQKEQLKTAIQELQHKTAESVYQLFLRSQGTAIETRVNSFFQLVERYVNKQNSIDDLRRFVAENYQITLEGAERMRQELVPGEKALILLNHYRQGPELMGFPNHQVGVALSEHDVAPVMAKLFTDRALEGVGIDVCRFGKPLHPNDEFYYRSKNDVGTRKISDQGVEGLAAQLRETWEEKRFPTVCPEAGLRCLKKWRSGSLTTAVLAGADSIVLMSQYPFLSLIDTKVGFGYIGKFQIPQTVKMEVESREDTAAITAFNNILRRRMAAGLVQANYEPQYTEAVKPFIEI